jgi:hypothetical protein
LEENSPLSRLIKRLDFIYYNNIIFYISDNTHTLIIPPMNITHTTLRNRWYRINLNCQVFLYIHVLFFVTYESFSTGGTGWYCVLKPLLCIILTKSYMYSFMRGMNIKIYFFFLKKSTVGDFFSSRRSSTFSGFRKLPNFSYIYKKIFLFRKTSHIIHSNKYRTPYLDLLLRQYLNLSNQLG